MRTFDQDTYDRMARIAALGSPERIPHVHIHVCPCPPGTPFHEQQFAAMQLKNDHYLDLSEEQLAAIARQLRERLVSPRP